MNLNFLFLFFSLLGFHGLENTLDTDSKRIFKLG